MVPRSSVPLPYLEPQNNRVNTVTGYGSKAHPCANAASHALSVYLVSNADEEGHELAIVSKGL